MNIISKKIDIMPSIHLTMLKPPPEKGDAPCPTALIMSYKSENVPPVKSSMMFVMDHPMVLFLL
jgi:hypothetical protein